MKNDHEIVRLEERVITLNSLRSTRGSKRRRRRGRRGGGVFLSFVITALFFVGKIFQTRTTASMIIERGERDWIDDDARLSVNDDDDDDDDDDSGVVVVRVRGRSLLVKDDDDDGVDENSETPTAGDDGKKDEEVEFGCFWTKCTYATSCPNDATANDNNKDALLTIRNSRKCERFSVFGFLRSSREEQTEKLCCDEAKRIGARWERGAKWAEDGNEDACFNRCPKNARCNERHGTCECDVGYVARDAPRDEDDDDDAAARMKCYPVRDDQNNDLPLAGDDVPEIEDPAMEKEKLREQEQLMREKMIQAKRKKIAEAKRKKNKGLGNNDDNDEDEDEDDIVEQPSEEIEKQLRMARRKSRMGSKEREQRRKMKRERKNSSSAFYLSLFALTIVAQILVCARMGFLTNVAMRLFGKNPRKLMMFRNSVDEQLLPTRLANSRERIRRDMNRDF